MPYILLIGLLAVAFIVGVWDVYVSAIGKDGETVSQLLYSWSTKYPILPFILGVLIGHIFWPMIRGVVDAAIDASK